MGYYEEQRQIEDSARSDRGAWLAVEVSNCSEIETSSTP